MVRLLLGLAFLLPLGLFAQPDTLTIRSTRVETDAQRVNLTGIAIEVSLTWRKPVDRLPTYTLTLALTDGNQQPIAYHLPEQTSSFLAESVVLTDAEEASLHYFIPYSQLQLPAGRHSLLLTFSATATDEQAPAPYLFISQPPTPVRFAQPALVKARVEVRKLRIRGQDAFGRAWDTAGATGADVKASLRAAAAGYSLDWHTFPRIKNTTAVAYPDPSAWLYLAPTDKLDLVIYDQDFNGPETIHTFTFSLQQLRSGSFSATDAGLVHALELSFELSH